MGNRTLADADRATMPDFRGLKTRFEVDGESHLRVWRPDDAFSTVSPVAPNEAAMIVDWMAKRTAANVAWLDARDEWVRQARETIDFTRKLAKRLTERGYYTTPRGLNRIADGCAELLSAASTGADRQPSDKA